MSLAVADSSALVSLGVVGESHPDPLSIFLTNYDVVVPPEVVEELRDIASYDDNYGQAATVVLDRRNTLTTEAVDLDSTFPLDDGENAAVTLANESDVSLFLCDEFNQLGLIHASLANTRLVTTPTLLSIFVRTDQLSPGDALTLLDDTQFTVDY
ncbi:hypothetical protein AB7C87_02745 [Natrarchaeobius sp. A-rgal3]|uniref:hypothetical protein n=1 Tax=Natrarchaeobius versutus TaxID=1679078 RepID=UPI003510220F